MKTKIVKVKGDWVEVKNDARFTMGKEPTDKEPSSEWKRKMLVSEHSPIRALIFKWQWLNMKHWVTVHWVRHKWEKMVQTQRSDRTGINRDKLPQDEPQNFQGEANVQHLIDTERKRLCFLSSPEAREYGEDLKVAISEIDRETGDNLVPNCVYRGGCPELMQDPKKKCRFYELLCEEEPDARSSDILERYAAYNRFFYNHFGRRITATEEN